jgi:hypothetical protein
MAPGVIQAGAMHGVVFHHPDGVTAIEKNTVVMAVSIKVL